MDLLHTLRSLLNELARLTPNLGIKRASSFNRDLRVHLIFFSVHLNFFSVCHLNFFQVYGTNLKKLKKIRSTEKKIRCAGPEIFLRFETDLNFSRP